MWEIQDRSERKGANRLKAFKNTECDGRESSIRDVSEVERRGWNENVFAQPNGLVCENTETAISCRRPGPARKKRYIPVVGRRGMHRCALVAKVKESRTHIVENKKCTRRKGCVGGDEENRRM